MDPDGTRQPDHPQGQRTFRMPAASSSLMVLLGLFFIGISIVFLVWTLIEPGGPVEVVSKLFGAVGAGVVVPFLFREARAIRTLAIQVDAQGIRSRDARGEIISIRWTDVRLIRERRFCQRMEMEDSLGNIIRIENQIEGFEELRDLVLVRTGWEGKLVGPDGVALLNGEPLLPADFRASRLVFACLPLQVIGVPLLILLALSGAIFAFWLGSTQQIILLLVLIPAVIPAAIREVLDFKWGIRVERGRIILRGWLRKVIPLEDIAFADLVMTRRGVAVLPSLFLELRSGKGMVLPNMREGTLAILRALRAAGPVPGLEEARSMADAAGPEMPERIRFDSEFRYLSFLGYCFFMIVVCGVLSYDSFFGTLPLRKGIPAMVFGVFLIGIAITVSIQRKWAIILEADAILLKGLLPRRIPFEAISSLSIRKCAYRPGVRVVLELRTGNPVESPAVREGSLALYRAICTRLRGKAETSPG